jgi:hypothetical protein
MTSSIDPNQLSTDTATSGAQGSGAFTPGPWFYRPQPMDDWGWVRDGRGYTVAMARNPDAGELEPYRARKADPYEANARLIVQAPAMYEALKDLLSAVEAQAQHAARVNTHSDAHLWEPSELLMKPARDALAAVDGRA